MTARRWLYVALIVVALVAIAIVLLVLVNNVSSSVGRETALLLLR